METRNEQEQKFLCFNLGSEKFAIPLLQVKEVIANHKITPIPQAPSHFRGFMDLRGEVMSVIELRVKFKIANTKTSSETTVIILDMNGFSLGVIVDAVDSVARYQDSMISEPPTVDSSVKADFIFGVARSEKELTLLIDLKKALTTDDLKAIRKNNLQAA